MQRIVKKISLTPFKTLYPLTYPAIKDNEVVYITLDSLRFNPNANYNRIPLGISEDICGHYSGYTKEMSIAYHTRVIDYIVLEEWFKDFTAYYDFLFNNECGVVLSSATEYRKYSKSAYEAGRAEYEAMDKQHALRGGDKFYKWLTDHYFVSLNLQKEYQDMASNHEAEFIRDFHDWLDCIDEIGSNILYYPTVVHLLSMMKIWKTKYPTNNCDETDNCCECKQFYRMGADDTIKVLQHWLDRMSPKIEETNALVKQYEEKLVPKSEKKLNMSAEVADFGNYSIFSTDYNVATKYQVGDVCTYNDKVYMCVGVSGGSKYNSATTRNEYDARQWVDYMPDVHISGGTYNVNHHYNKGDIAIYNNTVYACVGLNGGRKGKDGWFFDSSQWEKHKTSPGFSMTQYYASLAYEVGTWVYLYNSSDKKYYYYRCIGTKGGRYAAGTLSFDSSQWVDYREYYKSQHQDIFPSFDNWYRLSGRTQSSLLSFVRDSYSVDNCGNILPGYYEIDKSSTFIHPAENTLLDLNYAPGKVTNIEFISGVTFTGNLLHHINIFCKDNNGDVVEDTMVVCEENMSPKDCIQECKDKALTLLLDDYTLWADFVYYKACVFNYVQEETSVTANVNTIKTHPTGIQYVDHCQLNEETTFYYLNEYEYYPVRYYDVIMDTESKYSSSKGEWINVDMCDFELYPCAFQETIYQNLDWNNMGAAPLFRKEELLGLSNPEKVTNNIYIDRGHTTVLDKHLRMGEVLSKDALDKYGNGIFNLISSTEDTV